MKSRRINFMLLPLGLALARPPLQAQSDNLVRFSNPVTVARPRGYSQAAIIDLGKSWMLLVSGQVFTNIKNVLAASGGSMDNLVKIGIFLADTGDLPRFREVRNRYLNPARPPASTLLVVRSLHREDVLLEVEVTAIIPRKP